MLWNLQSDRPIYIQLLEHIQLQIISGKYAPGDKLPSVRDLAIEASVNPNTMQKALTELERIGLVYTQRTAGRFITEDIKLIEELKSSFARNHIKDFLEKMNMLGFKNEEILSLTQNFIKENDI